MTLTSNIAAVTLAPVVAFISHSRRSSASSTWSCSSSGSTSSHLALWKRDSLQEFVVSDDRSISSSEVSTTALSLTGLISKTVRSWRSGISFEAGVLSEITDMQAEDDGDEADWYAYERPSITRTPSPGPSRGRSSRRMSNRNNNRSRSCSCNSLNRATISATELSRKLIVLQSPPPPRNKNNLLAPPSDHRRARC